MLDFGRFIMVDFLGPIVTDPMRLVLLYLDVVVALGMNEQLL